MLDLTEDLNGLDSQKDLRFNRQSTIDNRRVTDQIIS